MKDDYYKTNGVELRKYFIFASIIILVTFYLLAFVLQPYLDELAVLMENGNEEAYVQSAFVAKVLIFSFWLIFSLVCFYAGYISYRVINSEQYPYSGMVVAKETKIIRGRKAIRRGKIGLILSLTLFLINSAFVSWMYYVLFVYIAKGEL